MVSFPLPPARAARLLTIAVKMATLGGKGSGNFGHAGRKGEIGGSAPSTTHNEGAATTALKSFLTRVDDPTQAKFILPDGTMLTHSEDSHYEAAIGAGTEMYDALREGVVRASYGNAYEIGAPISKKQAALIVEGAIYNRDTIYIDVFQDRRREAWAFDADVEPTIVRNRVNGFFKRSFETLGGIGSGNFGHAGRKGEVGGSAPKEATLDPNAVREERHRQEDLAIQQMNPLASPPFIMGGGNYSQEDAKRYIAAYGEEFKSAPLPEGTETGEMGECYKNATHLIWANPELDFAEGLAYREGLGGLAFMHAWGVTKDGTVIDPTWHEGAEKNKYFGIRYDRNAYVKHIVKAKFYGVLGSEDKVARKAIATGGLGLRKLKTLGGPGSGNFGHKGRPGEVGGSSSEGSIKREESFRKQFADKGYKTQAVSEILQGHREALNIRKATKPLAKAAMEGIELGLADLERELPVVHWMMKNNVPIVFGQFDPPYAAASFGQDRKGNRLFVVNGSEESRAMTLDPANAGFNIPSKHAAETTSTPEDYEREAYRGLVIHEAGHLADAMTADAMTEGVISSILGAVPDDQLNVYVRENISKYAEHGGPHEAAAEVFASIVLGRELPKELHAIRDAIKQKFGKKVNG